MSNHMNRREFLGAATGAVLAAGAGAFTGLGSAFAQQDGYGKWPLAKPVADSFNPMQEKGVPLEKQYRNWSELTKLQYRKEDVHPYTRCRVILLNGLEVEAAMFKHNLARNIADMEVLRVMAALRRVEQQQQKAVSGLVPGDENSLENTIGYEQVAVDLTAWCARNETDPYMRQAYEFGLLEDFDHLHVYSNMLDMMPGPHMSPERIVGRLTEIMPGRPTVSEHRHPYDSIRKPGSLQADPITLMNIMTLVAAEQQTMNWYMNLANRWVEPDLRDIYTEIGMIEEQHVSHYESLLPRNLTWMQMAVMHELHECWLYHSLMLNEPDPRLKQLWELHLAHEIGHLHDTVDLCKHFENRDPAEFMPKALPQPMTFESNIDYVRHVLAEQMRLTAKGQEFVPVDDLPKDYRYFAYNKAVNAKGNPTQHVLRKHIEKEGKDYRFETAPHPVQRFRDRKATPDY